MSSRERRRECSRERRHGWSRPARGAGARLWLLTAIVTGAIALMAVPAAARPAATKATQIAITDSGFAPPSIEVAAGTTVVWTNNGPASHDVTSTTGLFQSGALTPGQSFQYRFSTTGSYAYSSSADAGLTGQVTVTDGAVAASGVNAPASAGAQAAPAAPTQATGTPGAFAYTGPAESVGLALLGAAVILLGWGLLTGAGAPLGPLEPWRVLAFVDPRRVGFTDELLPRGLWRRSPRRSTQASLLPAAPRPESRGPASARRATRPSTRRLGRSPARARRRRRA